MPSKTNPRPWTGKKGASTWKPATFVNQELTREQRERLKATQFGLEEFENVLSDFCDGGYQVKISVDSRNNCYAAWLIPSEEGHENSGYILSGRGSTPVKAVKQVWFLHEVVFERQWGVGHGLANDPIDD